MWESPNFSFLCVCVPVSHPRGASGKFPEVNASSISLLNNTERGKQVLSDINKHDAAEKGVIEGRGFCIWDVFIEKDIQKAASMLPGRYPLPTPDPHTTPDHPLMKAAWIYCRKCIMCVMGNHVWPARLIISNQTPLGLVILVSWMVGSVFSFGLDSLHPPKLLPAPV